MNHIAASAVEIVEALIDGILKTMDGIPDDDLVNWKPVAEQSGGGEMNTFAALGVHTASAGSWMFLHQVLGDERSRDREAEFQAVVTRTEIDQIYSDWATTMRDRIEDLDRVDLRQMPPTIRESHPTWDRAAWLFHMIEHTGLHLGHLQIHRQLWEAERSL